MNTPKCRYESCSAAEADLEAIWERLGRGPISEREFLAVAQWAYHAMPAETICSATFQLYESVHTAKRQVH